MINTNLNFFEDFCEVFQAPNAPVYDFSKSKSLSLMNNSIEIDYFANNKNETLLLRKPIQKSKEYQKTKDNLIIKKKRAIEFSPFSIKKSKGLLTNLHTPINSATSLDITSCSDHEKCLY